VNATSQDDEGDEMAGSGSTADGMSPADGFDALEARLRELRGTLGLASEPSATDVPPASPHPQADGRPAAADPRPASSAPSPRAFAVPEPPKVADSPAVTLRAPRFGWDLVGLAAGWAAFIALIIGLSA
jgi:uncharacterized membrane protein